MRWTLFAVLGVAACAGRATRLEGGGGDAGNDGAEAGTSGNGGRAGSVATGGQGGRPRSMPLDDTPERGCRAGGPSYRGTKYCSGSYLNREFPDECPLPERTSDDAGGAGERAQNGESLLPPGCRVDTDCNESANGYCVVAPIDQSATKASTCVYACTADSDCGAGSVCVCTSFAALSSDGTRIGVCVADSCSSDASCEGDLLCISPVNQSCGTSGAADFHCQTPNDECSGPMDCTESGRCVREGDRFVCADADVCE